MESVDCIVSESRCMVSYDRSSSDLKGLKSKCFDFRIEISPNNTNEEIGVFEAKKDATVIRRSESNPFPAGTFKKGSVNVNDINYNVTLKKVDGGVKIGTFFV